MGYKRHWFLALVMCGAVASGKANELNTELQGLDFAILAEENSPAWAVPEPIQEEKGPVIVEQFWQQLADGYEIYGNYLYAGDDWHWLGVRVTANRGSPGRSKSIYTLGEGKFASLSLDDLQSGDPFSIMGENSCTDDPQTHEPMDINAEPGDQATYSWTNEVQQCDYQASYEYGSTDGGVNWGWIVINFEYTFTGDVIGGDDDDNDSQ